MLHKTKIWKNIDGLIIVNMGQHDKMITHDISKVIWYEPPHTFYQKAPAANSSQWKWLCLRVHRYGEYNYQLILGKNRKIMFKIHQPELRIQRHFFKKKWGGGVGLRSRNSSRNTFNLWWCWRKVLKSKDAIHRHVALQEQDLCIIQHVGVWSSTMSALGLQHTISQHVHNKHVVNACFRYHVLTKRVFPKIMVPPNHPF